MSDIIFSVKNVSIDFKISHGVLKERKILRALSNVSFELKRGRSLAIVGESGSGKSTICKVAMLFYKPGNGNMYFEGEDIHKMRSRSQLREYKRKSQMVFQDPFSSLNPLHSIYYHIARPLQLYAKIQNKSQLRAKVLQTLEQVGLSPAEEQAKKFPHQLSGGQKQRAFLGKILAIDSELIFADEPTSMLDVSIRLGILNLMNQMKQNGKSFIYVTHDIATARYFAEDILVLYCGNMVEWGNVDSVIKSPMHPYTRLLIAAAPDPEREARAELVVKRNMDIPFWTPQSKGCPFSTRCTDASKRCSQYTPDVKEIAKGHFVRCFKYLK